MTSSVPKLWQTLPKLIKFIWKNNFIMALIIMSMNKPKWILYSYCIFNLFFFEEKSRIISCPWGAVKNWKQYPSGKPFQMGTKCSCCKNWKKRFFLWRKSMIPLKELLCKIFCSTIPQRKRISSFYYVVCKIVESCIETVNKKPSKINLKILFLIFSFSYLPNVIS